MYNLSDSARRAIVVHSSLMLYAARDITDRQQRRAYIQSIPDDRVRAEAMLELEEFVRQQDKYKIERVRYLQQHGERLTKQEKKMLKPFEDPISHSIFIDPVICDDGHTYERSMIQQHFKTKMTSPLTNKPLKSTKLIPNHTIRSVIDMIVGSIYSDLKQRVQVKQTSHMPTTMSGLSSRRRPGASTRSGLPSTRTPRTTVDMETPDVAQQKQKRRGSKEQSL